MNHRRPLSEYHVLGCSLQANMIRSNIGRYDFVGIQENFTETISVFIGVTKVAKANTRLKLYQR